MLKSRAEIDMTKGVVWEQLVLFAVPVLLGEVFQQSYSIADSAILGHYVGDTALAAVGAAESITRLLVGFFNGISLGCTIVVARCFGEQNLEKLSQTVHTIVYMSFALGVLLSLLGILIVNRMLALVSTPEDVFPMAKEYLTIYFAGMSGLVLYNTISGIMRAVGDSRHPLYFLIFSSVLNITLDILFVAVWKMEIAGGALATILSQFISAGLCMRLLIKTNQPWRFQFKGTLNHKIICEVLRTGIPVGLQKSITSLSNVIVLSYIAEFGKANLAGWVVYSKVSHVLVVMSQSLSSAETTFISQNIGAGQYKRAAKGVKVTLVVSVVQVLAWIGIVLLFRNPITKAFGEGEEMLAYAQMYIQYLICFQVAHVFMGVYVSALRGIGKAATGTVLMVIGLVVVRQIYLMTSASIIHTPISVGFAYPLGWIVSGVLVWSSYEYHMRKKTAMRGSEREDNVS